MSKKMASKTRIKIEENSTSLIQSYINTFNKEIEENGSEINVSQCTVLPGNVEIREVETNEENVVDEDATNGTYFVDSQGHYYYQTDSQQVITSVGDVLNGNNQIMLAEDSNNEMLVDTAEGFQTITLVPSEDVSYVFVVQQGDEKTQTVVPEIDSNLTVYDFDENEDMEDSNHKLDCIDEDDKLKTFTKKQQPITKPHMCSYCSYTTSKKYLLSRHMKSHSDERPHKCTVCLRGFKTLASLQNHVNTHTGTKPHKCRFCGSAFTTSGELVRHVRYRHTHEKPHKCDECEYASVELSKLKRHARCHTGERPFQCPHCTYASPDTFKLKRHLRTHTGEKPYQCEYCNMCFTQSNSLKAHKLRHNVAEKPVFACELCPTTCGRKTDLRIHIQKLHTSDKPLKCRRCGKSFPDRYTFKTHIKTHDGEKCFKCDMCPYASASMRHLTSHMLVHTDEKPYACEHCEQSFRQKQLLRRHQNLYHNPEYIAPLPKEKTQECVECGKHFRHKGNLIRHMAMHDPESGVHEQSLQLKLGRQRKVQLNSMSEDKENDEEEEDEEEEYEEDESKDPNDDMPHYVVFEVIQMPEDSSDQMGEKEDEKEVATTRFKNIELVNGKEPANTEKDVENCFGFEVENTEDDLNDQKLSLYEMKMLRE